MVEAQASRDMRVLVLAPTARDGEVLRRTLEGAGFEARQCESVTALGEEMQAGAGAAVVAVEALNGSGQTALESVLLDQPDWSDFPLIIMETRHARHRPAGTAAGRAAFGHAVVMVRPIHVHTLLSAVRSALRSRSRQYEVRDELADRLRAEQALQQSHERKDEFLAMLGHELRNPLAAIRNATELIQISEPNDPVLVRAHGVLDRQSGHMARLIDGLLEVSRVARGKIQLEWDTIDLRAIVKQGVQDRMSEAENRKLRLEQELPADPVWVDADEMRLKQVLDNLIGNAIKFSQPEGRIVVSLAVRDQQAVMMVRDTGTGIRPQMLARLFDPFQQDTQDISRAAGGLGLGLALARGLVELHGGSITAHSEGTGTGARFEVLLPLSAAPKTAVAEVPVDEAPPRKILIVEDNRDAGETLCELLTALGHRAKLVEDGPSALAAIQDQGYDVVLCDLGLPGMTGYDVARAVRADLAMESLPLVALTGYGQPEDLQRSATAGFDRHLTKPVTVKSLTAVLRALSAE